VLPWSVRAGLLGAAAAIGLVFLSAAWIDPYDGDGRPLRMASHEQLGLPPCRFAQITGKPCPSCGMTTSFALLAHGDLANSLRANAVGTLLALFCVLVVPWNLLSAYRGRYLCVRSLERTLLVVVATFFVLMLLRWGVVLGQLYLGG
jgi:hypothetical protein